MALSKNLFLLSALLLLCGLVVGERGQSSQRRRTAIADRPSDAPIPSDDGDNDDMMLGKGGMPANSDDVGKGIKSSKYYKSMKAFPEDKSLPGKGMKSGKSAKSEYYGKGYGMSMSMSMDMDIDIDMELPDGKGAKMEKEVKRSKSEKSEKKLSKKDSKSEHGKLTLKPGMSPTHAPFHGTPSTSSPTSADSISSKSSAFAISYSPSTNIPTPKDLEELASLTQKYLEDFMMDFFEKTALTDLDNFLTIMVRDAFVEGEPVLVQYQSNGLFNPDSIFIPVTREIDNLIQDAIAQEAYLEMVKSLPNSNPFKETETIALTQVDEKTTTESSSENTSGESSSSSVRAGVAAAAAGIVVLAAGLAMLKSRRPVLDDDDDDVQSFSPQKLSSEDSTIAGETCNMSVDDASGHFAHWRTMKTYNNGTEGEEFEDEPLDSDDECEKMTPDASLS